MNARDLKIDVTRHGRMHYVTVTHLPTGRTASASGVNPLRARRECVTTLTQQLLDNPPLSD